jgi:acetyl-CoA C-acetyltransferase
MFLDGLEDAYEAGKAMGSFAQCTADEYQLTRQDMDEYSIESLPAPTARSAGRLRRRGRPGDHLGPQGRRGGRHRRGAGKGRPEKIPELKPAFAKEGTITAATSSSISDGAAAVVLTRESTAKAQGKQPVARIVAMAAHAQEPKDFTTARSARSARCSTRPAGRPRTSTCGK